MRKSYNTTMKEFKHLRTYEQFAYDGQSTINEEEIFGLSAFEKIEDLIRYLCRPDIKRKNADPSKKGYSIYYKDIAAKIPEVEKAIAMYNALKFGEKAKDESGNEIPTNKDEFKKEIVRILEKFAMNHYKTRKSGSSTSGS